jgi:hypothetical protein
MSGTDRRSERSAESMGDLEEDRAGECDERRSVTPARQQRHAFARAAPGTKAQSAVLPDLNMLNRILPASAASMVGVPRTREDEPGGTGDGHLGCSRSPHARG